MAELGYFGMSVPEEYGGQGMGNLAMVVITEELSAASLAGAGSLITRPEILTKALLKGGTEAQKRKWLPPVAAGELMVGISVTEPDTGSDVASVRCRAERGDGGWLISGAKAWCTFAGRANVLALLARTNPDPKAGARGLSLFIVPKDAFPGHEFEVRQPGGGTLHGKADPTPGYRGMHSYTLAFERYFVPAENLIGEKDGEGKGFYLQMNGFAAGRLQTGRRASGRAQGALEVSATYASERKQFGRPIGEFQLTQYKLGRMGDALDGRAPAHLRRSPRDGRRRKHRARAGDGEAVRLGRRGVGDAGRPADPRRLGLRRGVRDLAPRERRAGAADLRGREADPRAEGDRAGATGELSLCPGPYRQATHPLIFSLDLWRRLGKTSRPTSS
jgi:alkylation response protein AidB-like acyl-CoA dehydrogenase